MPKQICDIAKNVRLLHVRTAVKDLGRASADEVMHRVSQRLSIEPDNANLKRAIYRDLKTLADSGELGVQYFTPDGVPIPIEEEDKYKNVRTEYFLAEGETQIVGQGLLSKYGGAFISPSRDLVHWKLAEIGTELTPKHFYLIFEAASGNYLSLSAPLDDRPFTIIISRRPTEHGPLLRNNAEIEQGHGRRTGALFLNDRSISRFVPGTRPGHALVQIEDSGQAIKVMDFGSTRGTQWTPADSKIAKLFKSTAGGNKTTTMSIQPFSQNANWQKISANKISIPLPAILNMGQLTMVVLTT